MCFNVNKIAEVIIAEVINGVQHRERSVSFDLSAKLIAKVGQIV
ncbi:MAG: hypothetical protein ACTS5A_01560 [Candidatus Hodgkinia cicadicola]